MVGLHVQSRRVTITTHRSGISFAASIEILVRKPVHFFGPKGSISKPLKISMPWSHLSRVVIAGIGQSTTDSWLLLGCSFLNIVGLPSVVAGSAALNEKFSSFVAKGRASTWSYITSANYRILAKHVASLPAHRWVQRALSWHPFGIQRVGRQRNTWESNLAAYCRCVNLRNRRDAALDNIPMELLF